ncbi:MAG: NTP transferase domain-containing protein [Bacteroidetes bacterium]|nr:NTP transferase domain-containing protein [Bacteroidota bacterium]
MKGMILAAGEGRRLRPLTNNKPKALVEIKGVSLLEILIKKFIQFEITDIVINTCYLANQIEEFLTKHKNFGINIQLSKEDVLLDTGGGIKQAGKLLGQEEDILVHNVDIISNIDFNKLSKFHQASNGIASLAVSHRQGSRYFLFNEQKHLCGWTNVSTKEEKISKSDGIQHKIAFSGIQIISPKLFQYMPSEKVFSLVDLYLHVCKYEKIMAYEHNASDWYDVGKIQDIEFIKQNVMF